MQIAELTRGRGHCHRPFGTDYRAVRRPDRLRSRCCDQVAVPGTELADTGTGPGGPDASLGSGSTSRVRRAVNPTALLAL